MTHHSLQNFAASRGGQLRKCQAQVEICRLAKPGPNREEAPGDKNSGSSGDTSRQESKEFEQDQDGSILEALAHEPSLCVTARPIGQQRKITSQQLREHAIRFSGIISADLKRRK
jgi:hypothetical protein